MIALDLFCGAGGASQGLVDAGFDHVVGVDINPQKNYPFEFIQMDVLDLEQDFIRKFDFVWASPPCQRFSVGTKRWSQDKIDAHPDLVEPTRKLLEASGRPFVLENVPGAPLRNDLTLCGFMFDLGVIRHRVFEIEGFACEQPEHKEHVGQRGVDYFTVAGNPGGYSSRDRVRIGTTQEWRDAMGIQWMTSKELVESVPPAYSHYIAQEFLKKDKKDHGDRAGGGR